jgi:hypothetical protein
VAPAFSGGQSRAEPELGFSLDNASHPLLSCADRMI